MVVFLHGLYLKPAVNRSVYGCFKKASDVTLESAMLITKYIQTWSGFIRYNPHDTT